MGFSMHQQLSPPDRVSAALRRAGVSARIEQFSTSTRTAQEAADSIGTQVGQIVKSLLFFAGEDPVLALVSGVNQLDVARLASLAGAPVRKADANAVRDATSYAIGGVPPTGFPPPLRTLIDPALLQDDDAWGAAGPPRHGFSIAPHELARARPGTPVGLARG